MTTPKAFGPTVLVVDDDADVRELTALALRRAGYEVVEAINGQGALDIVAEGKVGIVVMDVGLPDLSGHEVVATLRGQPETATLPILLMTGSGDEQSVISGLGSGADDFLSKPIRLDELVARVQAHVRSQAEWTRLVGNELRARQAVVAALGALQLSAMPEQAATAVVAELARGTDSDFLSVLQLDKDGRLLELATYNRAEGLKSGGAVLASTVSRDLVARAHQGPWIEDLAQVDPTERTEAFAAAGLTLVAGAPIFSGDELVGLLSIGLADAGRGKARAAHLLAAAIDYASVLGAVAGVSIADRRDVVATRTRLRQLLAAREFRPVFQPIVELERRRTVGYEALTRFDDGTPPDTRFAEAARVGLAVDFELGAIRAALELSTELPAGIFLTLNVSPEVLLRDGVRLGRLLQTVNRPVVLELTEHAPIADYGALRAEIAKLGDIQIAVDDAGAGFASMRHILELKPAYAKLDISLVRGIDGDPTRQAMAAGLEHFALRADCRLIAEGVETSEEADTLEGLGIDLAQGYLFGRPHQALAS